jgi:hypothetical protein
MPPMNNDCLPNGSLHVLEGAFTTVVADGEYGIFAIGVDLTDPDFPEGSAVLFVGDDGRFEPSSPRFSATEIDLIAHILAEANETVGRVCVASKGRFVLRSRSAQAVPEAMPLDTNLQSHLGFLATNARFCALVSPYGDDLDHVALHLMMADDQSNVWRAVSKCDVHWLPTLSEVAGRLSEHDTDLEISTTRCIV